MHPSKAPGPDGLNAAFYQKYWHIVGEEVCTLVLDILNNKRQPDDINNTFVALIPKVGTPETASDFRPISLCNVVMKLVTKTIANRLKRVLPFVISENQSAFVANRLITDNALIAFDTFHYMKKKKTGRKGFMALKLEMSKAYDRVDWRFLHHVMLCMNFPSVLVDLVMRCVTSVSYSILVNGHPGPHFSTQRGLRQGDPISPYLFIMCAEVFSELLSRAQSIGCLKGIKIGRHSPEINHLFFTDDSII